MDIYKYFEELWFNKNETNIFLTLYKLWIQPASVIANNIWIERTYVYKILVKFVWMWIVSETIKLWVKNFFIENLDVIKKHLKKQSDKLKKLEETYFDVEKELLKTNNQNILWMPKINIFNWILWLSNIYNNIIESIEKWKYISIKLFASNTFESKGIINEEVKVITSTFFEELKIKKVSVEAFLWNWISLMETLTKINNINTLENLPAWNSAINIYLIWKTLYIIIFKDKPLWIKIENDELWDAMHFIFDNLRN